MKTNRLTIYRPVNFQELVKVPEGGYVEVNGRGLAIYAGLKDSYQFVLRNPKPNSQTTLAILVSAEERTIHFDEAHGKIDISGSSELKVKRGDRRCPKLSKLLEGKVI